MNRVDHLLVIVAEESAEVTQEASKCLRFGVDEVYAEIGISNSERLIHEFNDLYAVLLMLNKEGAIGNIVRPHLMREKREKVNKMIKYSENIGRVCEQAAMKETK